MKRTFSDDDIVKFLYDEMDDVQHETFVDALCEDEELWNRYESLQEASSILTNISYDPSVESCRKVMEYVHHSHSQQQKPQRTFLPALQGALSYMLIFLTSMTIAGSVYHLRHQFHQEIAEQELNQDRLQWDDEDINRKIDWIQENLESIQESDHFETPL